MTGRLAALIGSPVAHSLSPVIHRAAFDAAGVDWSYVAFDVVEGQALTPVPRAVVVGDEDSRGQVAAAQGQDCEGQPEPREEREAAQAQVAHRDRIHHVSRP